MTPAYESYAEALYSASENLGCSAVVAEELPGLAELLGQCGSWLNNPLVNSVEKSAVLRDTLSGKVNPLTLEFVLLLTGRRHLKHFSATCEHFRKLCGHGKAVVRLRVPYAPEQGLLDQLKTRLTEDKLIPEGVQETEFQIVEDLELIGGLVASCNGYQIDTSLKTALKKMTTPERLMYQND